MGQAFFAPYDDFAYLGKVVDNDHIKIEYTVENSDPKNMGNRLYDSFGKPANQICGYPVNAWFFWKHHSKNDEDRPIDDWRKEWLDKNEP